MAGKATYGARGKGYRQGLHVSPVSSRNRLAYPRLYVLGAMGRLIRNVLVYGTFLYGSGCLSKSLMCAICQQQANCPAMFWISHTFITLLFFIVLYNFAVILCHVFFSGVFYSYCLSRHGLIYYTEPKTTRSGRVYGFM